MSETLLNRLLTQLTVDVEAFAVCEVARSTRLVVGPVAKIEIHYVLAGTLHLTAPGSATLVCPPGSLAIVPSGIRQIMAADDAPTRDVIAAECCSVVRDGMLLFDAAGGAPGALRLVCGKVAPGSCSLLDRIRSPIVEDLTDWPLARAAYALMLDEIGGWALGSRALIGALMKACLVMLFRRRAARGGPEVQLLAALQEPRLGKAAAAILDRPAYPHSLDSLAKAAGMSRASFARAFVAFFGMTPMAFVIKTRLQHAAEMLRSGDLPVKLIAASAGFPSRSHFSRSFRSVYGVDPTAFRLQVQPP